MKVALSISVFILLLRSAMFAQAVVPVRDKNTRREVERLVYKRWEKFTPKWYYTLMHRRYKKKDRRILWQLLPTMYAMDQSRQKAEEEREEMKSVHTAYLTEQLNREAESHYHLHFKPIFERLEERYQQSLARCYSAEVSLSDLSNLYNEKAMLDNYLKAIREGNLDQGESAKAMRIIQEDWEKLIAVMNRTAKLAETQKKFLSKGILN